LLTDAESDDRRNVSDITLLGERVLEAIDQAAASATIAPLPLGLFGAGTGAAAALVAAARRPAGVAAVVSRGGRPDLAGDALALVRAPTLLIVGGTDFGVIEFNEEAGNGLVCDHEAAIVPGATPLFEEAGALEAAVELASSWLLRLVKS
jgi:dienelactone hydrolase